MGEEDPLAAEMAYRCQLEANMESILDTVRALTQWVVGGEEGYGKRDEFMSTAQVGDVGHHEVSGSLAHLVGYIARKVEAEVPRMLAIA